MEIRALLQGLVDTGRVDTMTLLRLLKPGMQLHARVTQPPQAGVAQLAVGSDTLQARTQVPLQQGQLLTLRVQSGLPEPQLRIVQAQAQPADLAKVLLQSALPRQIAPREIQQALRDLTSLTRGATSGSSTSDNVATPGARIVQTGPLQTRVPTGTPGNPPTGTSTSAPAAGSAATRPTVLLTAGPVVSTSPTGAGQTPASGPLPGSLPAQGVSPAAQPPLGQTPVTATLQAPVGQQGTAAAGQTLTGAQATSPLPQATPSTSATATPVTTVQVSPGQATPGTATTATALPATATSPIQGGLTSIPQATLQQVLRTLSPEAPTAQQLTPELVKHAMQHSGIFFEALLAQGKPPADGDRKFQLLQLLRLLAPPESSPQGEARAQGQAEQRPTPADQLMQRLLRLVEGGLARIQTHQAHSLPSDDGARQVWQFEVPLQLQQQQNHPQVRIQHDRNKDTGGSGQGGTWKVDIEFEFDNLGEVFSRVNLCGERVSAGFWCQHDATADRIRAAIPKLEKALLDAGLSVDTINSITGEPPRAPALIDALLDEHA